MLTINQASTMQPQTALQDIAARLEQLKTDLAMNSDRLSRILDRAFGALPEGAVNAAGPRAVPTGEVGCIRDQLDELAALASAQDALVSRLDSLV